MQRTAARAKPRLTTRGKERSLFSPLGGRTLNFVVDNNFHSFHGTGSTLFRFLDSTDRVMQRTAARAKPLLTTREEEQSLFSPLGGRALNSVVDNNFQGLLLSRA